MVSIFRRIALSFRSITQKEVLKPVCGGICLVLSLPPWGFWPLAFLAFAILDQTLKETNGATFRFFTGFGFAVGWIFPGTFWMIALTVPGYFVQGFLFSGLYALSISLIPRSMLRLIALPAAFTLIEAVRYRWPFGGVPLATIAMSQSNSPFGQTARFLGPLFLTAFVIMCGMACAMIWERKWRHAGLIVSALLLFWGVSTIAPKGSAVSTIDIAIIQGGGEQGTRAINTNEREVFERHVEATGLIQGNPDVVLWPEDVVNLRQLFIDSPERLELSDLAEDLDTWLLAGIFERLDETSNANATVAIGPDGEIYDRYDKVRLVPFGEYVPFRSLIEPFAPEYLPVRDTVPGTAPPNLTLPFGNNAINAGISISWEIFFEDRSRSAIRNGGKILLNPTNGSSYWLRILQTQQVASSQLRAIENGRWVLQAAPTGFSAIINSDGKVMQRTSISEMKVLEGQVELRDGLTIATRVGPLPMITISIISLGAVFVYSRKEH